ncbi:PadR family transcriptional regulator [Amycolatopsis viridis]|uniref:DNA-binding PadR family transcriptional regulator n=1 Tax=Amycolatopsis viridis TaxID=185678 RepID=A0ABX0SZU2_9PSEU|nr:PadR family transcriptional regulator [Amycolatopsis viridis]NIH82497.1 DNA-binding PadR family transcriptional regulator [Amycolatopsis viridis]
MSSVKLTPLALAILELLHERPMHPYEMTQLMRDRHITNRVPVKPGSLYHTVDRLLTAGHIAIVETQREGRRPERTVYALTEEGRDAFTDRAQVMLGTVAEEYPQYVSGLSTMDDLGRDVSLEQLRLRVMRLEGKVAEHEAILRRLETEGVPRIHWVDWCYTTARLRFELDWTRELIQDITTGRLPFSDEHPQPDLSLVPTESTEDRPDDRAS